MEIKERIRKLKAMDTIMCLAEDEQVIMAWLMGGVPDEADEDDFRDIAEDDFLYYDVCACFSRLISAYSHLVFGTKPKE
jgi:hypothetical protein